MFGRLELHEPLVLALDGFAIDEQGEPLLERKRGNIGLMPLLLKGPCHTDEAERGEPFLGWMCEHRCLPGPHVEEARRGCGQADDRAIAARGSVVVVTPADVVVMKR